MSLKSSHEFTIYVNIWLWSQYFRVSSCLNTPRVRCHTFPFIVKTVWSQQQQIPLLKDTPVGVDEGRIASSLHPLFSVWHKTHSVENPSSSSEPEIRRFLNKPRCSAASPWLSMCGVLTVLPRVKHPQATATRSRTNNPAEKRPFTATTSI